MSVAPHPDFDEHEDVVFLADEATGLAGVIAIHSTARGPAAGGCRMATYVSPNAALTDALRLSRGMSYKNALADLPAGGGKAVLYAADPAASREAVFTAFAKCVERIGGRFVTAEDLGTSVADMEIVARHTSFVGGLPRRLGCAGGDPSPWTALGVFVAIERVLGGRLHGARVAVQGLGAVGFKLCALLDRAGVRLVVGDLDPRRVERAELQFSAEVADARRLHAVKADVFSPNAMGGGLNVDSIPELAAPVVCGAANNQLATPEDGRRLFARGVTYAPDYLVNAGGIINVVAEYHGESDWLVEGRVRAIGDRLGQVLSIAAADGRPPHEVADKMARDRLRAPAATAFRHDRV